MEEKELTKEINVVKIKIDKSAYGDTTILENKLKRLLYYQHILNNLQNPQ